MNQTMTNKVELVEVPKSYYVENASGMIYEAQLFDGFVLCRPATPALYQAIRKFPNDEFCRRFTEADVSVDEINQYMNGGRSGI